MERDSFVFYRSFFEAITEIQDKALRMDCFNAIVAYGLYGVEPQDDTSMVQMVFKLVKPQIDANNRKFENGKKGAEFGKLGGRPKKSKNPLGVNDKNPLGVNTETPNVNVNVNENDNVNVNKESKREKPVTRFSPPTVEEVKAYCLERNNQVDAERFVDFYASKGWKVGSQGMKDWKAAVRTWEKSDTKRVGKVSSFNNFQQNRYDFDDLESKLLDN